MGIRINTNIASINTRRNLANTEQTIEYLLTELAWDRQQKEELLTAVRERRAFHQRVADEMTVSHPELGAEFALVNAEIRAGVDRAEALKNLAERTGLADIRGLVALLVQLLPVATEIMALIMTQAARKMVGLRICSP